MALTPLRVNPPTKGVNTTTPIRELTHEYAVTLDNVWMDKAGSIQARPGQQERIPAHAQQIKKLFEYVNVGGSATLMMQDALGVIYIQSGASWLNAGAPVFAGILGVKQLGLQLILGDGATTSYYSGGAWVATSWKLPNGIPNLTYNNHCNIYAPHNGRMFASGGSTFRTVVFFSDVLSSGLGASAGVSNWIIDVITPANNVGGFIDVSGATGNGDPVTGIASFQGLLVVFTTNSIVFYNANSPMTGLSVHKVIHGIGCIANESIQGIGNNTIFLSQYGFLSLREVLVQGDAAAEKSSIAINNFIVDRLRTGLYTAANVSSAYSQELGIYLCSFGGNQAWAYHELFGGWMPWFGVQDKLFVSSDNTFYVAGLITAVLSASNAQDNLGGALFDIGYLWETAPFRSSGQEIKARWNKAELIYESEDNAVVSIKSWINLDKTQSNLVMDIKLNPNSIIPNPTGLLWATTANPTASPRYKWGGLLNPLLSPWAGTLAGNGIVRSGSTIIPLTGKSEMLTLSVSNISNKSVKITALEVYRNDGGLR